MSAHSRIASRDSLPLCISSESHLAQIDGTQKIRVARHDHCQGSDNAWAWHLFEMGLGQRFAG
jgi:hypothetical protein